jgi:putative sterol carrier protein
MPGDFVGAVFHSLLQRALENEELAEEVKSWRMTAEISADYYPISIDIDDGVAVTKGSPENPTLRVKTSFKTVSDLALGRVTPFGALLRRRLKIGGMIRHPISAVRFYRLMAAALGV